MQLARDPHPLGVDAPAGFILPGLLSAFRPVLLGVQPLAARRHVGADRAGGEQLGPHRRVRASEPAERPEQPLGDEDGPCAGEPGGYRDPPRASQRDPVQRHHDGNERGSVDLAERRPADGASHREPEHLDRPAVAPDQSKRRHGEQKVGGQRRMAGQVQPAVMVPRVGLGVSAGHGEHSDQRYARGAPPAPRQPDHPLYVHRLERIPARGRCHRRGGGARRTALGVLRRFPRSSSGDDGRTMPDYLRPESLVISGATRRCDHMREHAHDDHHRSPCHRHQAEPAPGRCASSAARSPRPSPGPWKSRCSAST